MTAVVQSNLILAVLFSALFIVAADGQSSAQTMINGSTRESFTACEDNSEVALGEKVLQNNVWNRDSTGVQCVFPGLFSGLPVSGPEGPAAKAVSSWIWSWPRKNEGDKSKAPLSYPSLIYGFKPWRGLTTMDRLPVKVSTLNELNVTYAISTHAQGAYNTSFEIWLTRSGRPKPEDITTEVMIWLNSHQVTPAGNYKGTVELDGEKYGLWVGRVEYWRYIVFNAEKPSRSGSLKLKSFLDELKRRREIGADTWLSSVEFGNEITSGRGRTIVKAFNITSGRNRE
jgi:hypothetical protein